MTQPPKQLIVVGQGAAGLAAALAAAEEARRTGLTLAVTILDKAAEGEAGGNTRSTPSYMRMVALDRVEESFAADMMAATDGRGDRRYFERLAAEAPATMRWIGSHGVEFHKPVYYLAKGPPRIQPVGGGQAIVGALTKAANAAGVTIRYGCTARALAVEGGALHGVEIESGGRTEIVAADAVVLASGGFQGDPARMREHFGPRGETMKLISPGTRFNTGDGIAMARAHGVDVSGQWDGMHCEPIDPRSKNSAPVVLVYPYGVVVDKAGRRFFDEGAGLVHETWEAFARDIQFNRPDGTAFAILDRRLFDIPDWQRATRSEVPPAQADTLEALARAIGVDPAGLAETVARYNAACTGDASRFDAAVCDGLAAAPGLFPPKSNWARAISELPFVAYPLIGAIAYTFGGLATDERARALRSGEPFPGLYAAGEITGHFYGTAPNAVSVLRAFVFGRIAGLEAVSYLRGNG